MLLGLPTPPFALFASFTVSRFKMSLVELSITGDVLVLVMITLTCFALGLFLEDFFQATMWTICLLLVVIFLESYSSFPSSSAAPPACLDGFSVETNGGTGGAYTCTPLHP